MLMKRFFSDDRIRLTWVDDVHDEKRLLCKPLGLKTESEPKLYYVISTRFRLHNVFLPKRYVFRAVASSILCFPWFSRFHPSSRIQITSTCSF